MMARSGRLALIASVVLVCSVAVTPAAAQSAVDEEVSAESPERRAARELFQQGVSLMDAGRYEEALTAFEWAYARWQNPKILLNIATALLALERPAEAAARYEAYLENGGPSAERAAEAKQTLEAISARVSRLIVKAGGGLQRVELDAAPVAIELDRVHWLAPGRHVIVLSYGDGQRITHGFEASPGQQATFEGHDLLPKPLAAPPPPPSDVAPPPAEPGRLRWAATVRADIDGLGRGGAGALGIIAPLSGSFRVGAGALLGSRVGGWLGIDAAVKLGAFRPSVGASLPTFWAGGTVCPGVGGELGVRYELDWVASPLVRVALVHFLRVPEGYVTTVVVPSVGVEVPL
jgi:hypothetical protein